MTLALFPLVNTGEDLKNRETSFVRLTPESKNVLFLKISLSPTPPPNCPQEPWQTAFEIWLLSHY